MRVEPFTIGDFMHIYNRGNRKMPIVYDEADKWRFLKTLRYLNDPNTPPNVFHLVNTMIQSGERLFDWPEEWPSQKSLVKILSYSLIENHFHLLLKEIREGGISLFMKKISDNFTKYINTKYDQVGRLFQGAYKGRKAEDEKSLEYLDIYIQVLNPFESYPSGIEKALKEFDKAFKFALEDPFCSLGETFGRRNLKILDRDVLKKENSLKNYKAACYEALVIHSSHEVFDEMLID